MSYNLSPAMHIRIIGDQFMGYRRSNVMITSATHAALQRRGLLDDRYHRTPEAMAYVDSHCDKVDARMAENNPDTHFIRSDINILRLYQDYSKYGEVSVYVYRGSSPMLVLEGNGSKPIGILSARYMWDIQVGMTNGVKNAGHFLNYSSISSHKGSYGYDFDHAKTKELTDQLVLDESFLDK